MRRGEREVRDRQRLLEVLESCDCLRLAMADVDAPYIVPVNFGWEEREGQLWLYFHGAREGRKAELLGRNPHVGFEADCSYELVEGAVACRYSYRYASVIGVGTVHFAESDDEKRRGLSRIMAHYAPGRVFEFPEAALARVAVGCLCVERISCKEHASSAAVGASPGSGSRV